MKSPKMKAAVIAIGIVAASAVLLTSCGGKQSGSSAADSSAQSGACEAPSRQLSIATGNSTGVYYVLGGGIADLLSTKTPLKATAAETGASVQNIEQVVKGDYDVGFSLADTAADAVTGTGAFATKQPIQALGRIHSNATQVIARNDSGIKKIADMKGKRVSTGSPKSGTEVIALRLLQAAGLNLDSDVSAQRLDLATSVDGLKDGTIDAIFWSGGLPTPNITELFTTDKDNVSFVEITSDLPELKKISDVYVEAKIPAATYGTATDIPTIGVPNVLVVKSDFDEATACAIVKTIWSNAEELSKIHASAKSLKPDTALETGSIPLNAGAKQALEELK